VPGRPPLPPCGGRGYPGDGRTAATRVARCRPPIAAPSTPVRNTSPRLGDGDAATYGLGHNRSGPTRHLYRQPHVRAYMRTDPSTGRILPGVAGITMCAENSAYTINVIQSAEYRLHDDRGAGLQNRNENEETRADRMGIMPPDRRAIAHGKSSKLSRELTRRARCACVPQGRGRSASIFFSGVQNGNEVQAQLLPAWSAISVMTFAWLADR
jgi:hypothetical protein